MGIIGLILFQFNVWAWNGIGHIVIAAEAFRQMSSELKTQSNEVFKSHPDYAKWINAYHPNPNFDLVHSYTRSYPHSHR